MNKKITRITAGLAIALISAYIFDSRRNYMELIPLVFCIALLWLNITAGYKLLRNGLKQTKIFILFNLCAGVAWWLFMAGYSCYWFFVIKPFPILGICSSLFMFCLSFLLGTLIVKLVIAIYEAIKENKECKVIQFHK